MFNITPNNSGSGYEILLKGHLETYWSEYFDGWAITNLEKGEVLLANPNIDQAGLHGVLNRIRDLNLTLLSVRRINLNKGEDYSA